MSFSFNYADTNWTDVHVNSNGMVGFGADVNPSGYFRSDDFFSPIPKIAPYFMDLNPAAGGAVYAKSEATKFTITWSNVEEFGVANSNTLQLVLHDDGSFDITFYGIDATVANNGAPITFGFHPGGIPNLEVISYSNDLPYSGSAGAGIYENYFNIGNPLVNEVALIQRFYQSFPDEFFQLIFFTNFWQTMSGFANERNIKNDVAGIGLGIFDNSALYGSNGVLESRCNMNRLAAWPDDPTNRFTASGNNFLTIMGQEAGHRWGAFVNFQDSTGSPSNMILGRADAHWSYFVDVDHSSLEGGNWEHVSGDLYTTPTEIDYFGDIDEYTFGLRLPEEVTSTFYVSSPTNDLPENRDDGTPPLGATANGTPVIVTIDDIIAAEGTRTPTEPNEEHDLRQAFILIIKNGGTAMPAELAKIVGFRKAWEPYFEKSCDGRLTCNTNLVQNFPVAVIKGTVTNKLTDEPVDDFLAQSLERGFDQFVTSGGRYTFRYQADSSSTSAETITIAFEAAGYFPDTLTTSVAYGSELITNIELLPVPTGIEMSAPIPNALYQNYPNPFNPTTTIKYDLRAEGHVHLAVYDVRGRLVRTLIDRVEAVGHRSAIWDGTDQNGQAVASGVYVYRFKTGQFIRSRKMLLIK
jgi:hypothetical protein